MSQEANNLALLKACLSRSGTNTQNMLGILNSFESRLQRLENTIVPVYNETENLRRRQESILCLVSVVCFKRYEPVTKGAPA